MVETLQNYVLVGALIFLSICLVFSFIRSLIGPKVADRIVAVNMIGTQIILIICIFRSVHSAAASFSLLHFPDL